MNRTEEGKIPETPNDGGLWGEHLHVQNCYQCQRCSSGCPVAFAMDLKPHQIMQAVSLGMKERVLSSRTPWICASCYTCTTRCPNEIDIAKVMDWLRQVALAEGRTPVEGEVALFHRSFLDSIRSHGRVHELGMIARYKRRTGKFFDDLKLGWKMFLKGKLRIWPSRIRRRREVAELFPPS